MYSAIICTEGRHLKKKGGKGEMKPMRNKISRVRHKTAPHMF